MIKFLGEDAKGDRIIGLGICRDDLERLVRRQEIVELELRRDFNVPLRGKIVVLGDETEAALTAMASRWITEDTIVHGIPRPAPPPEPEPTATTMQCSVELASSNGVPFVKIDWGRTIQRIGLMADQARALGEALIEKARELEAGVPAAVEEVLP